jgi:hypothetical protein
VKVSYDRKPRGSDKAGRLYAPPTALYGQGARLRVSVDDPLAGVLAGLTYYAPPDAENQWRQGKLDASTLDKMEPARLLEFLADLSPELSLALWHFNRFCNPGFTVKAFTPGTETINEPAQAAVDAFLALLGDLYGAIDVVIARLFVNAWMRGGFFAELVLDKSGRFPVDLATPDARWLQFRREMDPVRGPVWIPYQWQGSQQVRIDVPTVRYVPIDPLPGKAYGRALASPAMHVTIFTLGMLHDLRRVVQQQGWPRPDITLDLDQLLKTMPPDVQGDPDKLRVWLDQVAAGVAEAYGVLQPDDAYVHTSATTMNRPFGTMDSSSLGAVDGLIGVLERMAMRGLKSAPVLMGLADQGSETHANRVYELHIQGIKAIQHLAEGLLEYLIELGLRAQGLQATVEWRFAENRAAEMLRDQQTLKLKIQNAALAYARGWISQDEAALMALDREGSDQEEPRIATAGLVGGGGGGNNPDTVVAEPGSNRALEALLGEAAPLATNGNGKQMEPLSLAAD